MKKQGLIFISLITLIISPMNALGYSAVGVKLTASGLSGNDRVYIALYDFSLDVWDGENPTKEDVEEAYFREPNSWVVLSPTAYQATKININHVYVFIVPEEPNAAIAYDSASIPLSLPSSVSTPSYYGIQVNIWWGIIYYGCSGRHCLIPI